MLRSFTHTVMAALLVGAIAACDDTEMAAPVDDVTAQNLAAPAGAAPHHHRSATP